MSDSNIKTVFKNIAPAVVVMVAGLLGAFMVYDSYFSDRVETGVYSEIAPAAGEEAAVVVEETAEEVTTDPAVDAAGVEFVSKAEESAEGAAEAAQDAANSAETAEDAAAAATEAAEKAEDAAAAVEEKTEEHKH